MGITDWFVEKYDSVSSAAKEWASGAVDSTSQFYADAKNYVAETASDGVQAVEDKVSEAQWSVFNLVNEQKSVDKLINNMQDGAEKDRLKVKRDEARGIFTDYVAPLVNKLFNNTTVYNAVGFDEVNKYASFSGTQRSTMGFEPITMTAATAAGVGAVAAAAAVIYWSAKAYALENEIANDPSLTALQKATLVGGTGITGAIKAAKPLVMGAAVLAVVGVIYNMTKKA